MDKKTAETISIKTRALKHAEKILELADKLGEVTIKLNCTGLKFVVRPNEVLYLDLQKQKYSLLSELQSLMVTPKPKRTAPAPVGASTEPTPAPLLSLAEKEEQRKARQREYNRRYYQKTHPKKA